MKVIVLDICVAWLFVLLITGCARAPSQSVSSSKQGFYGTVLKRLPLIEDVPPKIGERPSDQHALAILSQGKAAAPFLIGSLTNASPSRVVDGFQYAIGDLAHRLLCEIYQKPFLWPVADAKPLGGHPQVSFQDYLALVRAPGGRQQLQQMWRDYVSD